jgi:hypothetical protein
MRPEIRLPFLYSRRSHPPKELTMTLVANLTTFWLVLVPTVTACSITDIAGNVDASSVGGTSGSLGNDLDASTGIGGNPGTGGVPALDASVGIGGQTGTGGTPTAPTPLPTWGTPDGCVTGNESAQFVGVWEGYIQGSSIGDESNTVRLNILGANANGLCGTITFGTHTAQVTLPPVTDSTGIYPPDSIYPTSKLMSDSWLERILGLPYTIQHGQIADQRATFEMSLRETYISWCSLQNIYQPVAGRSTFFLCAPGGASPYSDDPTAQCSSGTDNLGQSHSVSCAQYQLCAIRYVCECNSIQCTARYLSDLHVDIAFASDQATGTLNLHRVYTTDN